MHPDSFHFMQRFNCGLTEHHPLYGTFCAKLSACIFEWDREDVQCLKDAKRAEWKGSHNGHSPTDEQLMATISPGELKKHCRRKVCAVEELRSMISGLLQSVWDLTDTTGLRLVNSEIMLRIWDVQQKHLECLQDPSGIQLYTKVCTVQKGGKELPVQCGRRSSSLERFHRHQCAFIPGTFASPHTLSFPPPFCGVAKCKTIKHEKYNKEVCIHTESRYATNSHIYTSNLFPYVLISRYWLTAQCIFFLRLAIQCYAYANCTSWREHQGGICP